MINRAFAVGLVSLALAGCGGGSGGGSSSGTPGGGLPNAPSVSGDMLAYQANRGWNYQGTAFGGQAVTLSVYADPPSGGANTFVLFGGLGTASNAFSGTKLAQAQFQNNGGGYNATAYVLYNSNGTVYSAGAIPGSPALVPSTLTQGASFSSYPGLTAVVQSVGTVPGSSACPAPTTGATVAYSFQGQNYTVSYVPGCGITQYTGNNHEVITLVSVGTYQLGTQSGRRMDSLTIFDTLSSAAHILANHQKWQPFVRN